MLKLLEGDEENDKAEGFQTTNKPPKSIMKNSMLLNPSLRGLKSRDDVS